MKKFLYRTHIDYITPIWITAVILCFAFVINWYQWPENFAFDIVGIFLILLGTALLTKHVKKMGVYIDRNSIHFKLWFTKRDVSVEEIAAVKIEKAIQGSKNGKSFYLRDNKGNQLFSMIAVSRYNADMLRQTRGDT